jgi:hypothetical protein
MQKKSADSGTEDDKKVTPNDALQLMNYFPQFKDHVDQERKRLKKLRGRLLQYMIDEDIEVLEGDGLIFSRIEKSKTVPIKEVLDLSLKRIGMRREQRRKFLEDMKTVRKELKENAEKEPFLTVKKVKPVPIPNLLTNETTETRNASSKTKRKRKGGGLEHEQNIQSQREQIRELLHQQQQKMSE